ncbi:MAG: bifunctional (p)ppGpp synthetase/guanosine-3',5'-bis(diphosphate) 3'-pyrophosphohydrolase [Acidobacteriota bacterium]|nr:bifunctional (p)ppGpp synthetase/guanosine-3',5'-bis(diphosphate) 3'-pyrophosphohydrolase [Acidobacteriota bacterium]
MIRFDDILDRVSSRLDEKDILLLQKAYVFSARAHKGQVRRSGEPYLSHPLEVANQLAEMGLDRTTLAAGLLHDVLEDTDVTAAELRETFGKDITALVEGVTKIGRVENVPSEVRRAETIRKIILAMTDDLRVIFIKLADRLHNLQTLKFLAEPAQKRIAAETLEIYAPIANRLGMGRMKAELEDLAFRYVEPEAYFKMAALIDPKRKKAEAELRKLRRALDRLLKENRIPAEIVSRIKRPYSIYRKMEARKIDFDQVFDFLALRIITDSVKSCYAALGIIHQHWTHLPQRFRDFIAMPKPNLYQALHTTIITADKLSFEIQIRTREMHDLAENGIAAHWRYKEGESPAALKEDKRILWLREMAELFKEQKNPREFMESLKINLIPEEVYVLTPKGLVETLPAGSSALDFAFRVHTEIGLHAASARVNGKPAPLKTPLRTGDIVEIVTSPDRSPSRAWLNIAVTSNARQQIKKRLNQMEQDKAVVLGGKLWDKETRKYDLPAGFPTGKSLLARLRTSLGIAPGSYNAFLAMIGRGRIVINRKLLEKLVPEGTGLRRRPAAPAEAGIQVKDRSRALLRLARCCSPVKGEPIIGYITAGKGVTIHARRCPRVAKETLAPERIVDVAWGSVAQDLYKSGLVIRSNDVPGLLAKITSAISALGGDITKAEVETTADRKARIKLALRIRDIQELQAIEKAILGLPDVLGVERI